MRLLPCLLLCTLTLPSNAQPDARTTDDRAVLDVIDRFFAAMSAVDTLAMAATLTREGVFHAVGIDDPTRPARATSHADYLAELAGTRVALLERYWDPVVMVQDRIATVTTRYDFHAEGRFSHCGTDVFTLVLEETGWKISGGVYTAQRMGCPQSPLGPVE